MTEITESLLPLISGGGGEEPSRNNVGINRRRWRKVVVIVTDIAESQTLYKSPAYFTELKSVDGKGTRGFIFLKFFGVFLSYRLLCFSLSDTRGHRRNRPAQFITSSTRNFNFVTIWAVLG